MPTDPRRAKRLFDAAVERPPADRAAFLDGVCGGDAELRQQVDALLAALDRADEFLVEPASESVEAEEQPGAVIDRYKLLQEIGEGGMGTVWMAEQQQPVKRKVALKVIKLGMDTKQVVARFEAERQALALMDHPGIAKVLDGGATQQGRPYFVMELVKGVPITEYCDQAGLGAAERLELFQQVCHAVQHAHQKGVIHRDLKPGNILVTNADDGSPLPKVIDFGIAKATSAELTQKTLFTEFRQMVGTPEYMAPEQAELTALDVDTRADVYSLGVLLYEILTGTKPFELEQVLQKGYGEMMRVIREEDPPKPSTRISTLGDKLHAVAKRRHVSPHMLGRLMRGDLDWIVMRALEKDRGRRYATANDLAADIARHLSHEPVHASPPSASYRLRKYVRRHRVGVSAAAMVLVALVAGLSLAVWGFVEANDQREIAEQAEQHAVRERNDATDAKNKAIEEKARADKERKRAEAEEQKAKTEAARANTVIELVEEMLGSADPSQQKRPDYTVRQLLDDFDRGLGDRLKDQPEVEYTLRGLLASAYGGLTDAEKAQAHHEAKVRLAREVYGRDHREYAISLANQATILGQLARLAEAEAATREALAIAIDVDGDPSLNVALIRGNLATILRRRGELDSAERIARRAVSDLEAIGYAGDLHTANVLATLAETLGSRGKHVEAELVARRSLDIKQTHLGADHAKMAFAWTVLGQALRDLYRFEESAAAYRKALELDRKHLGNRYRNTGVVLVNLCRTLNMQGKFEEAAAYGREALEVLREVHGHDHPDVAAAMSNLATAVAPDDPEKAEQLMRRALEIYERVLGSRHFDVADALQSLANLIGSERPEEALRMHERALDILRAASGDDQPLVARGLAHIGGIHFNHADYAAAETHLREALAVSSRVFSPEHPYTVGWARMLAAALMQLDHDEEAESLLRETISVQRRVLRSGHSQLGHSLYWLGQLLLKRGKMNEAEGALAEAIEVLRPAGEHEMVWASAWDLGKHFEHRREFERAAESYRVAFASLSQLSDGKASPSTAHALYNLARALAAASKLDEAIEVQRQLLTQLEALGGDYRAVIPSNTNALASNLSAAGRFDEALEQAQVALAAGRARGEDGRITVASSLAVIAEVHLRRKEFAAAEAPARECLAIREERMPDSWLRYNAMSLLGGALAGLGKHEIAEPLLIEGYEKMAVPPEVVLPRKRQALERIVQLYESWGREDDAAKWRKRPEEGK